MNYINLHRYFGLDFRLPSFPHHRLRLVLPARHLCDGLDEKDYVEQVKEAMRSDIFVSAECKNGYQTKQTAIKTILKKHPKNMSQYVIEC